MDPRIWIFPMLLGGLLLARAFPIRPTGKNLLAGKGTGTSKEYAYTRDAVWTAVLDVVARLNLEIVCEDLQVGCIHAQSAMSATAWGERVAIFLEDADTASRTRVEVVSKPFFAMSVFPINWAKPILRNLDEKLASQASASVK